MAEEKIEQDDEISLIDLAATLWRQKWLIVIVTIISAMMAVGYALLQPNKYTATSSALPIAGTSSSLLSQYAGLASLAGVSLPGASAADPTVKIQAILNSRGFAEKLISKLELIPKLIEKPEKIKNMSPLSVAVEQFQKSIFSVSVDTKTSLIKISAKTKDSALSRDIVNTAIDMLQEDLKNRVLSASGKNIVVLEQQVTEQEKKVRELQARMTDFQKKNKLVSPQTQSQQGLELYKTLIQQKIALEIEIGRLENALAGDNPKLTSARAQLEGIKKQIADIEKTGGGVALPLSETPKAIMDFANLSAELELATKIYGGLLSSLESLRLQDATEKLFIEVIDYAIAPEKKSEPSRAMICVVGTMAGGFLAILLAFVREAFQKLLADPEIRKKFIAKK